MRVTVGMGSSREVPSGIAEGRVDVDSGDAEGRETVIWYDVWILGSLTLAW